MRQVLIGPLIGGVDKSIPQVEKEEKMEVNGGNAYMRSLRHPDLYIFSIISL